jgi:epoxide hydrolase-like predicted phosphatase
MNITTLIFDFDGVMSGYHAPSRLEALAAMTGLCSSDVFERIWTSGFEDEAEAGRFDDGESYLAAFAEQLGRPVSREQWIKARATAMQHWPVMHDLVGQLSARYRIALLTNNGPLTQSAFTELAPQTADLFGTDIYFSWQFGTKKPDPLIFEAIANRLKTEPEDCVFVDDKPRNVAGAGQTGMTALQFTDAATLRQDLARLDIAELAS